MASIIIILTLMAVGLYLLILGIQPKHETTPQVDFKDYWQSIRGKQGRFSSASRRR